MDTEKVTLVDESDRVVGSEEKLRAHIEGKLHRAFSVFVFNSRHELLLQKRSASKYHSPGLWSNTCCGHPRPGEAVQLAARRRLQEEMGFVCDLQEAFKFVYRANLDHQLIEHEFDYIFIGQFSGEPIPDHAELEEWKWIEMDRLRREIDARPHDFTYWLKLAINREEWIRQPRSGDRW